MQVLEREGYEVRLAPDGATALEDLGAHPPDVVLVDLKMPGMSGEEFLVHARELDPEVTAVAITGYPTLSSAIDVMKSGAYDFLPKPFKAEELRIVIGRALQRRRLAMAVAAGERERSLMRDNFVAMVSHQLKSPAATIKECLDTIVAAHGEKIPAPCRELLERAARKAGLLIDLMDDWLTLARVESTDGVAAKAEPVDLGDIAQEAIEASRDDPEANEVDVSLEVPDGPVQVRGDQGALREMLFNLIDNAVRYTPDGGGVRVLVRHEGGHAVLSVADNGPGMPQSELPLIFEPFFRGDKARERHGTGLGLAIARHVAEAHGGHLSVESEVGRGTEFTIHLPPLGDRS